MYTFQYKVYTNSGSRDINEDRAGVAEHDGDYCFAIADGLGGHGNGEIAAQIAIDVVCRLFVEQGYSHDFFENAFQCVQKKILAVQEYTHAPSRMKTTLVILVISREKCYWAHVGDSRLYLFSRGSMKRRTEDHSVPQMLVKSGEITDAEIRFHPDRNRLMRVMGNKGEEPRFDAVSGGSLKHAEAFLLCTDGFWELIDEREMEVCLRKSSSPEEWIDRMVAVVESTGANLDMDNRSAIAVMCRRNGGFWSRYV